VGDERHRVPGPPHRPPPRRLGRKNDWAATNKAHSWVALGAHVATYHLIMGLLLLLPVLRDGWPAGNAQIVLTVSAATHALIDRRRPVRALMRAAGSPGFATVEWA